MIRVVITGANGFIGKHLSIFLDNLEYDVYCIVRERSCLNGLEIDDSKIYKLKDNSDVFDYMNIIKPDILIHLAGYFVSQHDENNIENLLNSNIVYSSMILDAAVKSGCKSIINCTTYWEHYMGQLYYPVNLYAATKKAFKDIIDYYVLWKNIDCISLVIFDTYVPNDNRPKILNKLHELPEGHIFKMSAGNQKMSLCYIEDVCEAFERAIEYVLDIRNKYPKVHKEFALKTPFIYTLKQVVDMFCRVTNKNIVVQWGALPYRTGEIMNPDAIGIDIPGWMAKVDLPEGIRRSFVDI